MHHVALCTRLTPDRYCQSNCSTWVFTEDEGQLSISESLQWRLQTGKPQRNVNQHQSEWDEGATLILWHHNMIFFFFFGMFLTPRLQKQPTWYASPLSPPHHHRHLHLRAPAACHNGPRQITSSPGSRDGDCIELTPNKLSARIWRSMHQHRPRLASVRTEWTGLIQASIICPSSLLCL